MFRAKCIHVDAPCIEDLRAEIRQRPFLQQFADLVIRWDRYADEALALDRMEWAAICQEHAASAAHRLGVLEDAMLDIALGRRPETDPAKMTRSPHRHGSRSMVHS